MRFTVGLVALDHFLGHEMLDNPLRRCLVDALCVFYDPRAVEAPMEACGNPTIALAGDLGGLDKIIDQRLLLTLSYGEDVDLSDDRCVCANDGHGCTPMMSASSRVWIMPRGSQTRAEPLMARGSGLTDAAQVLFDAPSVRPT